MEQKEIRIDHVAVARQALRERQPEEYLDEALLRTCKRLYGESGLMVFKAFQNLIGRFAQRDNVDFERALQQFMDGTTTATGRVTLQYGTHPQKVTTGLLNDLPAEIRAEVEKELASGKSSPIVIEETWQNDLSASLLAAKSRGGSLGKRVIVWFSLLPLRLAGTLLVALGAGAMVLLAPLGSLSHQGNETSWYAMSVFALKFGITFLMVGFAVLFLVPGGASGADRGSKREEEIDGPRRFLTASLVVLPLLVLAASRPLLALWGEALTLMGRWGVWEVLRESAGPENGMVFFLIAPAVGAALLEPLLEAATAASFLVSSAVLLVLIARKSRHFFRVSLAWGLVQLCFLAGSFYALDLMANFSQPALDKLAELGAESTPKFGPELVRLAEWIRHHDRVVGPTARHFAWLFMGYILAVPAVLFYSRLRSESGS